MPIPIHDFIHIPYLLPRRGITRGAVDAWSFAAQRTNVRDQLPAMMYGIEKGDPQQSSDRVSKNDFLFSSDQPGRPVPCGIDKMVQSLSKRLMLLSIRSDHRFQWRRASRRVHT